MNGLIGKKIGMTRVFTEGGEDIPVTVIEAGPCIVTQIKTEKNDGYNAVQLGFDPKKDKNATMPEKGHTAKAGTKPMFMLREFENDDEAVELGAEINVVDVLEPGDMVDVIGKSKGKGFTGVVRKFGFKGGPKTRGQSDRWRAPGSIGASSDPSRVYPGMKMAGQKGDSRVTQKSLLVVSTDKEKNILLVKGAVPGPKEGYLVIRKAS